MTSKEQRLSLDRTTLENMPEMRLARSAEGIKVLGVPDDLLGLISDLGSAPVKEILQRFYLPNLLTYAFVQKGLHTRQLSKTSSGEIQVSEQPRALNLPRQTGRMSKAAEMMVQRGDVIDSTRALCIGDVDALSVCLQEAGARVTALHHDAKVLAEYESHGVSVINGDIRFMAGIWLGIFDLVCSFQREGDYDQSISNTVVANLRPYGAYYTYFVAHELDRPAFARFLFRIEQELIITDALESQGVYVVRAVKYPELRTDPLFFSHYV